MALEPDGPDDRNEEEFGGEDEELEEPVYQAILLFREFPSIDAQRLRDAINALEPGEDPADVSELSTGELEPSSEAAEFLPKECIGRRIGTGVVSWSDLRLAMIFHDWKAPEESLQFAAGAATNLPAVREALEEHQAYALINCLDVEGELHPVERMILMVKTAIAMADQGAVAYVNEHNATFFPDELLRQLGEAARESASLSDEDEDEEEEDVEGEDGSFSSREEDDEDEDEDEDDGETLSLWDSLREEGMPPELLVSLIPLEDEQGELWFVTRGHAQCELPELAYKARDISEYDDMDGHFKNVFSYMMENGPVLAPGHTLGYDENALMRFSEAPEDREFLHSPYGTLLVTIEKSQ